MGTLTDLNSGSQLPPEVAMDAEVTAADNAHLAASDPHAQYLLERLLPLLTHGMLGSAPGQPGSTTPFDANNWNPNSGQAHESAVNIAEIGVGSATGNLNLPAGSGPGTIVEIDPYVGTGQWENLLKIQLFLYHWTPLLLYIRRQSQIGWGAWVNFPLPGNMNQFTARQDFVGGIKIGASGSASLREISQSFTINPPALQSGSPWTTTLTMVGARVGDLCVASITTVDLWNTGLWVSELRAVVSSADTVTLYVRNDWTGVLDWSPFEVRVLVKGF